MRGSQKERRPRRERERERGRKKRKKRKEERKGKKKREEEPVPVHFWFPNGKTARGMGFLLLWLFLSKGHSMAMDSTFLVGLVHDGLD